MDNNEIQRRSDDAFGRLAHDFNCKKSKSMYYKPFADGVRHFKETEEGREVMCESVERYANKKSENSRINTLVEAVKMLMKNMKCSLEDALNTLEVTGKERMIITKQLQKG